MILLYVEEGRQLVNSKCSDLEPWQIIGATLITTLGAVWIKGIIFQPESKCLNGSTGQHSQVFNITLYFLSL